jgi:hypothetical protein
VITGNGSARNSDANGVGNVSGRNVDDSHVSCAEVSSEGRRPVVTDPSLCRAARYEVPLPAHLVLSFALLFFAVAASML